MDLDHQQLPYLKKLKLPSLQNLELQGNFITDEYFSEWILKQNMPKLRLLSLNENNITDHGIKLLVDQKFENFTGLAINNNRRLTSDHLIHLSRLNTSKLTRLELSHNTIIEKDLRKFLMKPFEKLERLKIISVLDAFDFFQFVNWKSMKNLRVLELQLTDFSQSVNLIQKNNITFPKLKIFKFGGTWISKQYISEILKNVISFGPVLELVEFDDSQLNPHTVYFNLSQIKAATIPSGMYLKSTCLQAFKSPHTGRLQIMDVILGDSAGNSFFEMMFDYSFFGNYIESQPFQRLFYYNVTQVDIVISHMKQVADWQNIQKFYMYELQDINIFLGLYFFQDPTTINLYYSEYFNFIKYHTDFTAKISFPYLRDINYIASQQSELTNAPKFLYYLNKMKTPLLNVVQLGRQADQAFPQLVNKLLKTNKNIKNLFIIDSRINCYLFQKIIDGVKLPFLIQIIFQKNQIQLSCFSKFISNHTSLKIMDLAGNFLERGLFQKVILENEMILKLLDISYMQIGNDQFARLAKINLQFITAIKATTININTEGIKMFVGNRTTQKLLPRCSQLSLGNNFINQDGVGLLLSTGMPFIKNIYLHNVNNPNLFNQMFSYPNSFQLISIQDANIYGIDPSLDKRSTRHVKILQLKSPSLTLEDFQVLSRMDFLNLLGIFLFIQNIYECEILKYILKIVQNTDQLTIVITNLKNKYKRLDDKCLMPNDPSQIYMKHLNVFNIAWQDESVYIPKFYTYFYSKDQLVAALILGYSLIGDEVLIEIVQNCNLQHLWVAILADNLLTDDSMHKFLSLPLNQIKSLILNQNEFTHKSLSALQNKVLDQLYELDLSQNPIDDEGIQFITSASFPKLMSLGINNCDITKKGLKMLSKLKAPQLMQINLANNLFDQHDLIEFVEGFQFENFPMLNRIETSLTISELNNMRMLQIITKKLSHQVTFVYDQYRLTMENKAQI